IARSRGNIGFRNATLGQPSLEAADRIVLAARSIGRIAILLRITFEVTTHARRAAFEESRASATTNLGYEGSGGVVHGNSIVPIDGARRDAMAFGKGARVSRKLPCGR